MGGKLSLGWAPRYKTPPSPHSANHTSNKSDYHFTDEMIEFWAKFLKATPAEGWVWLGPSPGKVCLLDFPIFLLFQSLAGEKKTERGAAQEVGRLKVWLGVEGGLIGFSERREGKNMGKWFLTKNFVRTWYVFLAIFDIFGYMWWSWPSGVFLKRAIKCREALHFDFRSFFIIIQVEMEKM